MVQKGKGGSNYNASSEVDDFASILAKYGVVRKIKKNKKSVGRRAVMRTQNTVGRRRWAEEREVDCVLDRRECALRAGLCHTECRLAALCSNTRDVRCDARCDAMRGDVGCR